MATTARMTMAPHTKIPMLTSKTATGTKSMGKTTAMTMTTAMTNKVAVEVDVLSAPPLLLLASFQARWLPAKFRPRRRAQWLPAKLKVLWMRELYFTKTPCAGKMTAH